MRYLLVLLLVGCASKPVHETQKGVTVERLNCGDDSCLFVVEFNGEREIVNGHARTHVPQVVWRTCVNNECGDLSW